MKKMILGIGGIFLIAIFCAPVPLKTQPVGLEVVDQGLKRVTLHCDQMILTTKNFSAYFGEVLTVIAVEADWNPLYEKKIPTGFYSFRGNDINQNIEYFERYYSRLLSQSGYAKELETVPYEGIRIRKVVVLTTSEQLSRYLKKHPKIHI